MVFKSFRNIVHSVFALMLLQAGNAFATVYDVTGIYSVYDPASVLLEPGTGSVEAVVGSYDDSTGIMTVNGTEPFLGIFWYADGTIFDTAGSYDVDTIEGGTVSGIQVGEGQWLGEFLYEWGPNTDIDVVLVWDVTYLAGGVIQLTSTDVISDLYPTGSGAPGHPTIDGPTVGFTYSFDLVLTPTAVPVPAAVWLFGSGLLGLIGLARRKQLNS